MTGLAVVAPGCSPRRRRFPCWSRWPCFGICAALGVRSRPGCRFGPGCTRWTASSRHPFLGSEGT